MSTFSLWVSMLPVIWEPDWSTAVKNYACMLRVCCMCKNAIHKFLEKFHVFLENIDFTSAQQSMFVMSWDKRFKSWMHSQQICSTSVMSSCQYEPNRLGMFLNTLFSLCHKDSRQFWRQKGPIQHWEHVPNNVVVTENKNDLFVL